MTITTEVSKRDRYLLHSAAFDPDLRAETGLTLLELSIAMSVLALAAMAAVGTMAQTAGIDEEMRERALAMRAALTKIEQIIAHDYGNDIQDLVDFYGDPTNASFAVDELAPPTAGGGGGPVSHGSIVINAVNIQYVQITVKVKWSGRQGQREIELPTTLTEIEP